MKVLAVKMPADCKLLCKGCRNPIHGGGDTDALFETVEDNLDGCDEVHITANGEVLFNSRFPELKNLIEGRGIRVSILCAVPRSIVRGLVRAEISLHDEYPHLAPKAIARARSLDVPPVLTVVDKPGLDPIEKLAEKYKVDAVLIRRQMAEGRATEEYGTTQVFKIPGINLGAFPVEAYPEVEGHGYRATCIGISGKVLPSLGGVYVNM